MTPDRLLSPRQVANLLGLGLATVYRRIADGTIPSVRIGESTHAPIRVDPEVLEQLFGFRRRPSAEGQSECRT